VSKEKGIPMILAQHAYSDPEGFIKIPFILVDRLSYNVINNATKIIALSNAAKDFLINKGVHGGKITVIPSAVDTDAFRPLNESPYFDTWKIRNKLVILTIGRLIKLKGLEYLIYAMKIISKKFPQAMLVILGKGPEKYKLMELVSRLSLMNYVSIKETFIPYEEMPKVYAIADVFVLPSIYEVFGRVLLEAMSCGKPIVGTNIGGIRDIIVNGTNGFLVSPRDPYSLAEKISLLLSDEQMRLKFGYNGREIAKSKFDSRVIVDRVLGVFKEALT
jgi:glycosyltransferase involved in cell wall biosynthesis